jgi:hypothetical protein
MISARADQRDKRGRRSARQVGARSLSSGRALIAAAPTREIAAYQIHRSADHRLCARIRYDVPSHDMCALIRSD